MGKILVVDDELMIRNLLFRMLQRKGGHQVILAANSQEGFKLANQEVPDLIILDVMMPGMNGWEVLKVLRTNSVTSHIPVLMLTAESQVNEVQAALDLGANGYLIKPVSMEFLHKKIGKLLSVTTYL